MTYEQAEKKYYEYLEIGNKTQAKKYENMMKKIEHDRWEKEYYENRIKILTEFIKINGLYSRFQIFCQRKVREEEFGSD